MTDRTHPTDKESPMTKHDRHDELKALLSKISEESVTTSDVLDDMLDLLRERLPEREGQPVTEGHPPTEEPPVGTYLVDRDGDVWERREDGWVDWAPEPRTWGYVFEFEEVRTRYAPLRFATPADLARVGIEEPAPADDLPGDRRVNVTITDVYAVPDEHGFLRINVGPEGATIDPDASNVVVTDVEPAPADDGLAEWERELFRPATCCGKCPPVAGGGYDCTCDGNPRCAKADTPEEWHDEPGPADDLPGEPVEPGDLRAGDRVAFTWGDECITSTLVSSYDGDALYSGTPRPSGYTPNVVWDGEWAGGISDVRLIERAPREDEARERVGLPVDTGPRIVCGVCGARPDSLLGHVDCAPDVDPDEALAMVLGHAYHHSNIGDCWLSMARAAREHIEAEADDADFSAADLYYARATKAERALGNATQRVLALAAERDKWNTLAHEADRNAKRQHDRAEKAETERDEWREIAARYADGRDKWQAKWRESDEARERAEADLADERDRHDATITERDALRDDLADATRQRDEYATQAERWQACHEALREDVETRWAFVDDNFLKDILHSILKGDDERAKGEQR